MASLRPSRMLLLNEHTAALDPKTAEFVLELTARIVTECKLTTSTRQALDYGDRTVMLHQGQVVLDVLDLLQMFEKVRHEQFDDDALLLN